jgi:alkanesulfonate monooxygenase SsuD/methylene tetrahydromethanopterin reductase-like flavin-dependent oxidoreductase (luciferase family)
MEFGLFLEFSGDEGADEAAVFQRGFSLIDEAEAMGVDSVWLPEYHFIPFSVLSSPIAVATAIAARTSRMRIGFGVYLLPLANPIKVAEEVATLDHISNGRVEFGVGRGTFPEHHDAFNSPYPESRGRFDEYLEIILKAWTGDEVFFDGEHYQCQGIKVKPRPVQKPHPPVRVGVTSAETFPIIGRMGYPIFINPSRVFALPELAPHIEEYLKAWKDAGHPGDGEVGLRVPIYVADTEEKAYSEPKESAITSMTGLAQRVAVSATREGTTGNWQAESDRISGMTYEDWLRDKVVYGTPDRVLDRLHQLIEDLHLTQIVYEINFGRKIPYEQQRNCLRLMTEQVIPNFK